MKKKKLRPKEKKRLKKRIKIYIYLSFAFLFLLALFYFINLDTFKIFKVEIDGKKNGKVLALAYSALQDNKFFPQVAFFIDKEKLKKQILASNPDIEQVEIKSKIFSQRGLEIKLKERKAKYIFCKDKDCFLADGSGYIFKKLKQKDLSLPIIKSEQVLNGKYFIAKQAPLRQIIPQDELMITDKLSSTLKKFNNELLSVNFMRDGNIKASSKSFKIFLHKKTKINQALDNLEFVLKNYKDTEFAYIDLRFGNKIFYKELGNNK